MKPKEIHIFFAIIFLLVVAGFGNALLERVGGYDSVLSDTHIADFVECAEMGNLVSNSNGRRECTTESGMVFVEHARYEKNQETSEHTKKITDFIECAEAGNLILELSPRRCLSKEGINFVENTNPQNGVCIPAGCSGQFCVRADIAEKMVTSCEWRDEYACYSSAICESQPDGGCGWTITSELRSCLIK